MSRFSKEPGLSFTKMHGLGNDYVYIEEMDAPLNDASEISRKISDRHYGVGSDGLVLIGRSEIADFRMRIFNADGSEAEMCGNAARCVGKYIFENNLTNKTEIYLETLSGIRKLDLSIEGDAVAQVCVDMGHPCLIPEKIPMNVTADSFIEQEITIEEGKFHGTAVSMGNPHLVIPVHELATMDLTKLGPLFEHHVLFPKRTNTEFVEVIDRNNIRMRVWERGVGETMACGTGACAALVACSLCGMTERKCAVHLSGGTLFIEWLESGAVLMSGPATRVFSGKYYHST